jgi:hypothetical protein
MVEISPFTMMYLMEFSAPQPSEVATFAADPELLQKRRPQPHIIQPLGTTAIEGEQ